MLRGCGQKREVEQGTVLSFKWNREVEQGTVLSVSSDTENRPCVLLCLLCIWSIVNETQLFRNVSI